jgi:hypothetical protein
MEIIFTIDNGTIEHEVIGAQGKECLGFTKPYEEALSTKEPERVFKAEVRQQPVTLQSANKLRR